MAREDKGAGVKGRGDAVGREGRGRRGGKGTEIPPLLSLHFKHWGSMTGSKPQTGHFPV